MKFSLRVMRAFATMPIARVIVLAVYLDPRVYRSPAEFCSAVFRNVPLLFR
jgi:ABC-type amino acid transport system permease subunit